MTENPGDQYGSQRPAPAQPSTPPSSRDAGHGGAGEGQDNDGGAGQAPPAYGVRVPDPAQHTEPLYGAPGQEQPAPTQPTEPLYGSDSDPTRHTQPLYGAGDHGQSAQPPYGSSGHGSSGYGSSGYGQSQYGQPTQPIYGSSPAMTAGYGPAATATKRRGGKRFGTGVLVGGMLLAGLLGGAVGGGTSALWGGQNHASSVSTTVPSNIIVNDTSSVNQITAAAAKASPSVVTIAVSSGNSGGSGSGIILDTAGHILTNTHVVTLDGTVSNPSIEVRTSDGKVFEATVVGTDPLSDLAVVKIDAPNLVPATLGDSSKLNVGDAAIAIGAPLGLSGTVTDGIISTVNRTIAVSSSAVPQQQSDPTPNNGNGWNFAPPDGSTQQQSSNQGSVYLNVIQTDAAINHGNSGGALVNDKGEIIGVNVAIASSGSGSSAQSQDSGSIGVGFAIPIDYAHHIADQLIRSGKATHGFLGVSVTGASSSASAADSQFTVGAQVAQVTSGSPADKAGVKKGDVIVQFGDHPIEDSESLTAAVRELPAGGTSTITVLRGGQTQTLQVTVGDAASQ